MFRGEALARAMQDLLRTQLPAALDDVDLAWAEVAPLPLPEVKTWLLGHHPTVLERPRGDFPIVSVMVAARIPQEASRADQWGLQVQQYPVFVDCFLAEDDLESVNVLTWRYMEAACGVLQRNREVAGFSQGEFEPRVDVSEAARQLTDLGSFYTQFGRVTVELYG